jgi:hypothetical protein
LVSCARYPRDFWEKCSSLALILSNFSSVNTRHFSSGFLSSNDLVCLNLFIYSSMTISCMWNCNILKFVPSSFLVEPLFI